MRKLPTHLKKIDENERMFFYFKLDASTYVLYDSDMGEPVAYGSYNKVGATITSLPKSCTIYYFELNAVDGWKMKRAYRPDKTTTSDQTKKARVQNKKEETQEEKAEDAKKG